MKPKIGFIKCCERHSEVMFQFKDLEDIEESSLQIGDDVEFLVKWDMEKGKQTAIK